MINARLERYAQEYNENTLLIDSLGMIRYHSAIKYCTMVIGNFSSGILEAPAMGVPRSISETDREEGHRLRVLSIVHLSVERFCKRCTVRRQKEYIEAMEGQTQPYGDGNTSERIVD